MTGQSLISSFIFLNMKESFQHSPDLCFLEHNLYSSKRLMKKSKGSSKNTMNRVIIFYKDYLKKSPFPGIKMD